jgi:RNA polymerase sigma factor (sigma-70 family)
MNTSTQSFEEQFTEKTGKNFNSYYNKYKPKLQWYVNNIVKDEAAAQDITTEAFMRALVVIDRYNPEYEFSTWLFRIANKKALQYLKDHRHEMSMDAERDNGTSLSDTLAYSDDTEEYRLDIVKMKYDIMVDQIDKLKPKYKTVLEMREIENMSYNDIAESLGANLSTVKNHIHQGRAIAREKVEKKFAMIDEMY